MIVIIIQLNSHFDYTRQDLAQTGHKCPQARNDSSAIKKPPVDCSTGGQFDNLNNDHKRQWAKTLCMAIFVATYC